MTKSELIEYISEKLKLPNGKAEQIVNCVFDSMVQALREGDGIEIRGFGSFTVRKYKSYEGRNPRTGETVHVAPKRLPFFKVGKDLRERVNAPRARPEPVGDEKTERYQRGVVTDPLDVAVTTPYTSHRTSTAPRNAGSSDGAAMQAAPKGSDAGSGNPSSQF